MRLSFILGIFVAFLVIGAGIALEQTARGILFSQGAGRFFLNLPGLLVVVGGTVAALIASFPFQYLIQLPVHLRLILRKNRYNPHFYIDVLTELSNKARSGGTLLLHESVVGLDKDPFLEGAFGLVSDGTDSEYIRAMLHHEISCIEDRHTAVWRFYDKGASFAPVFGIIGTLIGLVAMLVGAAHSEYIAAYSLLASMATALSATFYGIVFSAVIFSPIASRLRIAHQEEILCKEIIVVGALSISAGEKKLFVEKKLYAFLTNEERQIRMSKG